MAVGRCKRLMAKHLSDDFVMAWLGIKQNLGCSMSELVWGKADACLVPECVLNLVAKAGAIFRFSITAWKEIRVCFGG